MAGLISDGLETLMNEYDKLPDNMKLAYFNTALDFSTETKDSPYHFQWISKDYYMRHAKNPDPNEFGPWVLMKKELPDNWRFPEPTFRHSYLAIGNFRFLNPFIHESVYITHKNRISSFSNRVLSVADFVSDVVSLVTSSSAVEFVSNAFSMIGDGLLAFVGLTPAKYPYIDKWTGLSGFIVGLRQRFPILGSVGYPLMLISLAYECYQGIQLLELQRLDNELEKFLQRTNSRFWGRPTSVNHHPISEFVAADTGASIFTVTGEVFKAYLESEIGILNFEELIWFNSQSWAANIHRLTDAGVGIGFLFQPVIKVYDNQYRQGDMSTCIDSIYYDLHNMDMYIYFVEGQFYVYHGVRFATMISFLYAMSRGEHFNYSFRNNPLGARYASLSGGPAQLESDYISPDASSAIMQLSNDGGGSGSSGGFYNGASYDNLEIVGFPPYDGSAGDTGSGGGDTGSGGGDTGSGGGDTGSGGGDTGSGGGDTGSGGGDTGSGGSYSGGVVGYSVISFDNLLLDSMFVTISPPVVDDVSAASCIASYSGSHYADLYKDSDVTVSAFVYEDTVNSAFIFDSENDVTICAGGSGTVFNGYFIQEIGDAVCSMTIFTSDDDVFFSNGVEGFVTVYADS